VSAPELTILIPAYNEAENLPEALPTICDAARAQARSFEVVVVDDGSTDSTAAIVRELAGRHPGVRLVQHERNLGPGSGIPTGLREARGDFVIFIPADIAIDLSELHRYLEPARAGADVVVGLRSDRRDYSFYRKINSYGYIALVKLLYGMPQAQFNYVHLYRRRIFERIEVESRSVFVTAEILIKARDLGYAIAEVEIGYVPRVKGTASCGRPRVVARTGGDLLRFWPRWAWGRLRGRPAGVRTQ
jgi:glycosyltransferase involved in cell wall biosynthesis